MDNKKTKMVTLLSLLAFMANGDNYAAAPLLIKISEDLGISLQSAAYSVTAYMLAFGAFTLIFGPLSDRFGKVRVINIAAFGTAIFSILGGFAFNLQSLIIFRAFNGAFGAGIFPVTLALVGQSFNNKERQGALGKVMGTMFLGGAVATAIGGTISYFGSWRMVYIIYGVGELIAAIIIMKTLERDKAVVSKLNIFSAYKTPFANFRFMRLVTVIFFVGFTVFGSFTYSGKLIQQLTGYSVLQVGFILSFFGLGTVLGGRIAPKMKSIIKKGYYVIAGIIGFIGLFILSYSSNIVILSFGLFIFGLAFISLQTSLLSTAQAKLPKMAGTAMSLASFNMFVGGALGTAINGNLIVKNGISSIYFNASFIILIIGIIAEILILGFEMRQKQLKA